MMAGGLILFLLQQLEKSGITTVYLRNYEMLPSDVGNDVDLLIPKGARHNAFKTILSVLDGTGWNFFRMVEFGPLSVFLVKDDGSELIHLDLFDRMEWHCLEYANSASIISNREWNGLVYKPCLADEVFLNIVTRLIYAGSIRDKHRHQLDDFFDFSENARNEIENRLAVYFGFDAAKSIIKKIVSRDWSGLELDACKIRCALLRVSVLRHPASAVQGLLRYMRRSFSRICQPPGPFIVFEGADGVGKSTVMDELTPLLKGITGRSDGLSFHWKPTSTSIKLAGSAGGSPQPPHDKVARSLPASFLFLGYHWLGFWLGYLRYVLPARAKNRSVLGDRYSYEFMLDPTRLRLSLPSWILRIAAFSTPKPDCVVCLVAEPSVIVGRKNELNEIEIERYQGMLRGLADEVPNFVLINADQGVGGVVRSIRAYLLARFKNV